jgi:mannose/fructose/N-acetylgalactosamine-specific phosphotransferase system component IIC
VARYWYMLLIGYVLFAYMKVSVVGIALFGIAIAIMFVTLKPPTPIDTGRGGPGAPSEPAAREGDATNV